MGRQQAEIVVVVVVIAVGAVAVVGLKLRRLQQRRLIDCDAHLQQPFDYPDLRLQRRLPRLPWRPLAGYSVVAVAVVAGFVVAVGDDGRQRRPQSVRQPS